MRIAVTRKRHNQFAGTRPGQCRPAEIPFRLNFALQDNRMAILVDPIFATLPQVFARFPADHFSFNNRCYRVL